MSQVVVSALYKFVRLDDFESLKTPLLEKMKQQGVRGTLLLAAEGINGTIAGSSEAVEAILGYLKSDPRLVDLVHKESYDEDIPFSRTKVKLKKEIVTMGVEGIDPLQVVGTYVEAKDWNDLISQEDVLLVDTRNDYEVGIGTFKNAINPETGSFREFPAYVEQNLDQNKHKKVAMFCTGGIRCEKSTAYLKEQGFEEVYHLKGGILKYLEEVEAQDSLWQGECFVFDSRVAVNQQLEKGSYDQCFACRYPITEEDKLSEHYVPGISCHRCISSQTEKKRQRFSEREKQIQLSKVRGEQHVGGEAAETVAKRRAIKKEQRQEQILKSQGGRGV
jgi:UPF0176 protein